MLQTLSAQNSPNRKKGIDLPIVFFLYLKKENRCLFSCTKFSITKKKVMKNHIVHTVIYVEDSSICVSSFFPSWL